MKNDWNCILISFFLALHFFKFELHQIHLCTLIFTFRFGLIKKKKHWKTTFRLIYFPFVASFFLHRTFYYIATSLLWFRCLSGNCNKIDNFILYMRSWSVLPTVINNRIDSINVSTLLDCWWWLFSLRLFHGFTFISRHLSEFSITLSDRKAIVYWRCQPRIYLFYISFIQKKISSEHFKSYVIPYSELMVWIEQRKKKSFMMWKKCDEMDTVQWKRRIRRRKKGDGNAFLLSRLYNYRHAWNSLRIWMNWMVVACYTQLTSTLYTYVWIA